MTVVQTYDETSRSLRVADADAGGFGRNPRTKPAEVSPCCGLHSGQYVETPIFQRFPNDSLSGQSGWRFRPEAPAKTPLSRTKQVSSGHTSKPGGAR